MIAVRRKLRNPALVVWTGIEGATTFLALILVATLGTKNTVTYCVIVGLLSFTLFGVPYVIHKLSPTGLKETLILPRLCFVGVFIALIGVAFGKAASQKALTHVGVVTLCVVLLLQIVFFLTVLCWWQIEGRVRS